MFITVLPKPDESYVCAAKIEDLTPYGRMSHIPTTAMHYTKNCTACNAELKLLDAIASLEPGM